MKSDSEVRLTEEQIQGILARHLATRDVKLRDQIVLQYKQLVESIARRFAGSGESIDDLVQEGYIGLLTATDLYDVGKGVKFSTYATHFIIGQIKHALRDKGKIIKEPAWLQELNSRMTRIIEGLSQELGRQPTCVEIGREMHLPEETVAELLTTREVFKVTSLDSEQDESSTSGSEIDKVSDDKCTTFQLPVEDKIVLEMGMNKLKLIEQKVIQEFYYTGLSQTEIAKKLGISCNYVSHILRNGTKKLRRILTTDEIREVQMQLQLASRRSDAALAKTA
jgi:RNA polymerase sigma-B factor